MINAMAREGLAIQKRRMDRITMDRDVDPIEYTASPAGVTLAAAGTRLLERDDFDTAPSAELGRILALPQTPPWMTEHFPEVAEAADNGGPAISEYTQEWFERIVWVSEDTLEVLRSGGEVEKLELLSKADQVRNWLASPASRGCARSSPMVHLYEVKQVGGDLTLERDPQIYQCVVEAMDPAPATVLESIAVRPFPPVANVAERVTALQEFVASTKHLEWKTEETVQGLQVPALAGALLDAIKAADF